MKKVKCQSKAMHLYTQSSKPANPNPEEPRQPADHDTFLRPKKLQPASPYHRNPEVMKNEREKSHLFAEK
jgi:hypothetical protein